MQKSEVDQLKDEKQKLAEVIVILVDDVTRLQAEVNRLERELKEMEECDGEAAALQMKEALEMAIHSGDD